jgi:hypothetical protein
VLAVVVTAVTAALALLLFGASEYGTQIFPPLWGILAILPAVAGPPRSCCSVAVQLTRTDDSRAHGQGRTGGSATAPHHRRAITMPAIIVLVLAAVVALTVLGFVLHILFSPWLLVAAGGHLGAGHI